MVEYAPGAGRGARCGYTPAVPAEQIASNLSLINWTLLTGIAVGSFVLVALARLRTAATKGYLGFTALCAVGFGVMAYLSDTGLPVMVVGSPVTADPAYDAPRRAALVVFGLARGFADSNSMPILCQIAPARYRATGYGVLNFFDRTDRRNIDSTAVSPSGAQ